MKAILFSFLFLLSTAFNVSHASAEKDAFSLNNMKGFESFSSAENIQEEDKIVIFYFTAAWCGPCQRVFPKMKKFADANKDKVKLILAQYKNQDETAAGEAMFGQFDFYPFGYALNSKKSVRDNGAKVVMDLVDTDHYRKVMDAYDAHNNNLPAGEAKLEYPDTRNASVILDVVKSLVK